MDDLTGLAVVHVNHRTKPNVAGLLGISSATAWRMAASGELPTIKIGRARRVPVAALLRLIEGDHGAVQTHDQDVAAGQGDARDVAPLTHVTRGA